MSRRRSRSSGSHRHCVALGLEPNGVAQGVGGDDVDIDAQQRAGFTTQCNEIQQRSAWLQVDEQVDIACWAGFPARRRPKDPDISSAVSACDVQQLSTMTSYSRPVDASAADGRHDAKLKPVAAGCQQPLKRPQ
jgi:hypothetical protein